MHFLAPAFLAGLAGAALPLLLHLVGRRKPVEVRFPAVEFILRSTIKAEAGLRLKRLLLLVLRTAAAALIALALARPFLENGPAPGGALAAGRSSSVIIALDTSLSMAYRDPDGEVFARARDAADAVLASLPPGAEAAYMEFADEPEKTLGFEASPFREIRKALRAAHPTARITSVSKALARARDLAGQARDPRPRIVLISDLCGPAFAGLAAEALRGIELADVGRGEDRPNTAVAHVSVDTAEGEDYALRDVTVEIVHHGGRPRPSVPVAVRIGGKVKAEGFADLDPHGTATKRFRISLEPGEVLGEAFIAGDGLTLDDTRYFVVSAEGPARVLLVSGDPNPVPHSDETFFLERALCPERGPDPGIRCRVIDADTVSPEDIDRFDGEVILLANVPAPALVMAESLRRFVQEGGSLFIAPGERSLPDEFNAALGELLPGTLGLPRTTSEIPLHLEPPESDEPVLSIFSGTPEGGLTTAEYSRILPLAPFPQSTVRLRFEDRSAALAERPAGRGTVAYYASTVDWAWNNLPAKPAYLPLMRREILSLSGRLKPAMKAGSLVGETVSVPAQPGERVTITAPDGTAFAAGEKGTFVPEAPGVYTVAVAGRPVDALAFAVNVDPRESDLSPARPAPVASSKGMEDGAARAAAGGRRVPLWGVALAALLAALCAEGIALGLCAPRRPVGPLVLALVLGGLCAPLRGETVVSRLQYAGGHADPRPGALRRLIWEINKRTSVSADYVVPAVRATDRDLFKVPFLVMSGDEAFEPLSDEGRRNLRRYLEYGGLLFVDDCSGRRDSGFDRSVRRELGAIFPDRRLARLGADHSVYRAFYLIKGVAGRTLVTPYLEGIDIDDRTAVIYCTNDLEGAWMKDAVGGWAYETLPGGELQRRRSFYLGVNIIVYALTVNYKQDLVHQPFIRDRLR